MTFGKVSEEARRSDFVCRIETPRNSNPLHDVSFIPEPLPSHLLLRLLHSHKIIKREENCLEKEEKGKRKQEQANSQLPKQNTTRATVLPSITLNNSIMKQHKNITTKNLPGSRTVSFDLTKSQYFQYYQRNDTDSYHNVLQPSTSSHNKDNSNKNKKNIKEENRRTLRQMMRSPQHHQGKSKSSFSWPDNEELYFRGLESKTLAGSCKRRIFHDRVIQCVLMEQDRQRQRRQKEGEGEGEGKEDLEVVLAQVYQLYSIASQTQAHRIALQDELAAREVK